MPSADYDCATLWEYQQAAERTASPDMPNAYFALGLCGEAGEASELVKKAEYHGHTLDKGKLTLELGDVLWHVAMLASRYGIDLQDVAEANIEKLAKRYPNGFDPERSRNR